MKTDVMYERWRQFEAYAVPMTEKGERLASRRWVLWQAAWHAALEESTKKKTGSKVPALLKK